MTTMIETLLNPAWILIFALTLDAVTGDAKPVFNRIPHPVVIIGNWITFLEQRLNLPQRSDQDRLIRGGLNRYSCAGAVIGPRPCH